MKLLGTFICLLALFAIVTGDSIDDHYRYCNYINHDIAFTLSGVSKIVLEQKEKVYEFERTDAQDDKFHFLLKIADTEITPGNATITQTDQYGEEMSVDIVFSDVFFEPNLKRMDTYTEIIVTEMNCRFDRNLFSYVHYNSLNQAEVIEFKQNPTLCGVRIHSTAPTGYYEVFVKNPYTLENVQVSYFTHVGEKKRVPGDDIIVEMPIPTKIVEGYVSFKISYNTTWEEIKQIYVLREKHDAPFIITSEISAEGNYFEHKLNGHMHEYVVYFKLEEMNIMYFVERILFNNYEQLSFDEYEYTFGYYFSIPNQFVLSQSNKDIELVFDSREQCETYKTNIYFKDLLALEGTIKNADCSVSVDNILKCKLDTTSASVYALGITQGMVSAQIVNLFTYSLDNDIINICAIEAIYKEKSKFDVNVYLPEYKYDDTLKIEGTLISEETFPGYCSISKGDHTYNHYILACDANKLENGLFGLEIGIGFGDLMQYFNVNNVNININEQILIDNIKEKELILTSQDQKLTITFVNVIAQGSMKEIQLRQNDIVSKIFTVVEDKTSSTKVYPIYDLIKSGFRHGSAHIYYKYPCSNSDDFEDSGKDIMISLNNIKSIEPNFVNIISNTKAIVTFNYPLGGINAVLKFESGAGLVEFDLSGECCDKFEVYGSMFTTPGSYYVSLKYPSIGEEITHNEVFYVFTNGIILKEDKDYVRPGAVQQNTTIELLYPIMENQIYKIEYINTNGKRTQLNAEQIAVNYRTKSIIIKDFPVQLQRLQQVQFVIYDVIAPEVEIIYTIYCQDIINLRVANLDFKCQNPALEGTNYVYFNFTVDEDFGYPYNAEDLQTITFNRINRSSGNSTEFVFCKYTIFEAQDDYGIHCDKAFENIETTDKDKLTSVRADVYFTEEDKYYFKYELASMSDQYITRYFQEGECFLIDFSISKNIFGFIDGDLVTNITTTFEAYDSLNAQYLKDNITCAVDSYCEPLVPCEGYCFGETCGKSCDVQCELIEGTTQLSCNFKFKPVTTEATIYYRMSEIDVHHKPLHIIKVKPPTSECRLYNDERPSQLEVCTYEKINGLRLFLNDDARETCDCDGIEIKSEKHSCTTIPIGYRELLGNDLAIKIEKDYIIHNSFTVETEDSQIRQIQERLMDYQGKLYAQLKEQEIVYTFPEESDASLISKIIFRHTLYENTIEIDFAKNCTKLSNYELECHYDLTDKLQAFDLGEYRISYIHSNCDVEFQSDLTIVVHHPPIQLLSLRPRYAWLGEPETFTLTYLYYFYNSENYHPQTITLVKVDDETIRKTVTAHLNKTEPNEVLFYSTEEFDFVPQGTYYIIENYLTETRVHKNLTILFLQHHIKIYPESVTYYTDMPAPSSVLTHFLDRPIYLEQIRSVRIPTINKDVQYEMTHTNITFIFTAGLIDFTREGEYKIVITEIDGNEVSFTVYVRDRKLLRYSKIIINGPQPGYENTTNIVVFESHDYDLSRVTRIEFELVNEVGVAEKYTIDRIRVINSYDKYDCTLKVELYLRHNTYYRLVSIHNDETNDMNNNFDYILQGFFLESPFYLVSKETNFIMYHINFYTVENAKRITYIYENNKAVSCLPIQNKKWIYECTHYVKLLPTGSYADLLNVTITKDETDIERTLQVYLVEYEIVNQCVVHKEPNVKVEVNLRSQGEISTLRGVFQDKYFNGNSISFGSIYNHVIPYILPIDYTVLSYDLYVQFPKFNQYFQYLIPNSNIKIVPHVFIVDVPENTITGDSDKEGDYFDVELNEGLKENDISRAVLENLDSREPDVELTDWIIMYTEDKTVFNFRLTEEIIKSKGEYYLNIYDACGNLVEPADYKIFISYEFNYLTHISPRAVKLSEFPKTEFKFIYDKALNQKPVVTLVDQEGRDTNYYFEFQEPFRGDEVRVPLKAYITGVPPVGLFRIKSTFPENTITGNKDLSKLQILVYENDVEFTTTEFAFNYKSSQDKLIIPLKYAIMKEQISRVTRKIKGIRDEVEITNWQLVNNQINIPFSPKLIIDNEYQILFYLAKDSSSKVAVEIKPIMPMTFHINRKFVYLGADTTSFEIQVTPYYDSTGYYKDVVGVTSSREELTFTEQRGTYKVGTSTKAVDRRFVATYKKLSTVVLPEVLQLRYYVKNIVNDIVIKEDPDIIITTEKAPFFDFGMLRRIIYKTEPFDMKLLDSQYFSNMNYDDLKAYLIYGSGKKLELTRDDKNNNNRIYYLAAADKPTDLHGKMAEIVIVEKNTDNFYVHKGEKVEFSDLVEPPLPAGKCQNDGVMVGGSCQCKEGFYGQYCGRSKETITDFTKEFYIEAQTVITQVTDLMSLKEVLPTFKEELKDYSNLVKTDSSIGNLGLQETLGQGFTDLEAPDASSVETLFLMGDLMINEYNNIESSETRRLASKITPDDILKKLRQTINDVEVKKVRIFNLPIQDMHFDKIKATEETFKDYQEYLKSVKSTYFEIPNMKNSPDNYYIVEFGDLSKSSSIPLKLKYTTKDGRVLEETEITPEKQEGNIIFYFNLEELKKYQTTEESLAINTTLLQEYSAKGINVYSDQDPAFNDKCYTTNPDYFDYDLTQKYRKGLYRGNSLGTTNSLCEYNGLTSDGTYISFACDYPIQSEGLNISLDFKQQALSKNAQTTHNFLALKCLGQITDIPKNIALWLFAVLAVLFVVGAVLKFKFTDTNNDTQSTDNNQFKKVNVESGVTKNPQETDEGETVEPGNIKLEEKDGFCKIFINNLIELHPITANCYSKSKSITSIFILTICSLFGFNALYFKESYIEERIYDNSRNSFAYPLVNEASIIFASIFTTVLFTVLAKLIAMVGLGEKQKSMVRDVICLAVCGVLILFWWIYSIGFCGMYKNTQTGWLCAGIWALLFNWIIFAPVSVLIVSILESKLGKEKIKVVKQLFWV